MVDFIVIGAMKSGTSTLYHNFKNLEEISLTKEKEANFFSKFPRKDETWYKKQFKDIGIKGDISPNYSRRHIWPDTSLNILKFSPETKIIYIVRDPIDRIISHLHHDLLRGRLKFHQLEQIVSKKSDYILTSSYFYQLKPYLDLFPTNRILVLSFEDLIRNEDVTKIKICNFIGESNLNLEFDKPYNVSKKRYKIPYYDLIHNNINSKQLIKLYHLLWYFLNIKVEKPVLSDNSLRRIKHYLEEDVIHFSKLFPELVIKWKKYHSIPDINEKL